MKGEQAASRRGFYRYMPGLGVLLHYQPTWLGRDVAAGLFDFTTLRDLYRSSRRELLLSLATIALHKIDELREELAARGVMFGAARVKRSLSRFFDPQWMSERSERQAAYRFATLRSAVRAYNTHRETAPSTNQQGMETVTPADRGNDNRPELT